MRRKLLLFGMLVGIAVFVLLFYFFPLDTDFAVLVGQSTLRPPLEASIVG